MAGKKQAGRPADGIRITCSGYEMRPVSEIIPYARNAKVHTAEQVRRLRSSLREFGFVKPVLIDAAGNLIAGHGILEAARAEGMEAVPCIRAEGLTEAQRKAYILADNKLSELAEWDMELVQLELEDLQGLDFPLESTGFDLAELGEIDVSGYTRRAPGAGDPPEEATAEDDDYDGELPEACPHKPGDVFRLGRHVLVCGDCTDPETAKKFHRGGGKSVTDGSPL